MDEHHAGGSDGNGSATKDIEDISSYRDDIFCTNCKVQIQGNEFQCSACGQYIGNQWYYSCIKNINSKIY